GRSCSSVKVSRVSGAGCGDPTICGTDPDPAPHPTVLGQSPIPSSPTPQLWDRSHSSSPHLTSSGADSFPSASHPTVVGHTPFHPPHTPQVLGLIPFPLPCTPQFQIRPQNLCPASHEFWGWFFSLTPHSPSFGVDRLPCPPRPSRGADSRRNKALGRLQPHLPGSEAVGRCRGAAPGYKSRPEFPPGIPSVRPSVRLSSSRRRVTVPMSFSRRTVYSSSVRSGGIGTLGTPGIVPGRRFAPLGSAASVYAGAGGAGSRISVTRTLSSAGGAFGAGYGAGLGGNVFLGGSGAVANEKEAMQDLNDRLAAYLEQVRSLERENRRLETQIREFMAQKGPSAHDWSPQWELIEELRDKV
uniref:IF rod domain-containing protein n=1 Tax=Cyanoderma ruficeps TaxID=181631 RepID=A0A8C3QGI4_9PASS